MPVFVIGVGLHRRQPVLCISARSIPRLPVFFRPGPARVSGLFASMTSIPTESYLDLLIRSCEHSSASDCIGTVLSSIKVSARKRITRRWTYWTKRGCSILASVPGKRCADRRK